MNVVNIANHTSRRRTRKKRVFICLMLAFPVLQFLVFWVFVNFNSIVLAFQNHEGFNDVGFTLKHFADFFTDFVAPQSDICQSVINSLWLFPVGNFVSLPLSLILSYILFKKVPGSSFFRVVFFLPSVISSIVMVSVFKSVIAVDGPVDYIFRFFGSEAPMWLADDRFAFPTILFYTVWFGLGFNIVLLSSATGRIPQDIFEYDRLEGVSLACELTRIVLPLIWPTITTMFVINTAGVFTTVGPIILMTNGQYKSGTIAFYIFNQVKYGGSYNYPSAVGLVFTAVAMPLVLGVKYLFEKIGDTIEF